MPRCFHFGPDPIYPHRIGDANCLACSERPQKCQKDGCSGLVHHEVEFGDEYSPSENHYLCDVCGVVPRDVKEVSVAALEKDWEWQRGAEQRRAEEEEQRRASEAEYVRRSSPEAIADLWIANTRQYIEDPDLRDNEHCFLFESGLPDFRVVSLPSGYSEFAGALELFGKPVVISVFDRLICAINAIPGDVATRAAALAFGYSLSTIYPRVYAGTYPRWLEDEAGEKTYEVQETPYYEKDSVSKWEPMRSLYRGLITQIAALAKEDSLNSWPRVQWEITAAYAASDYYRARNLFDLAGKEQLVDADTLADIRLSFEYFAAFGPMIDNEYEIENRPYSTCSRQWNGMSLALVPYSLHCARLLPKPIPEQLSFDQMLIPFTWGTDEKPLPELQEEASWRRRRHDEASNAIEGDGAEVLRSLLTTSLEAQLFEASGDTDTAAQLYETIGLCGQPWGIHFLLKAARLYSKGNRVDKARQVLEEAPPRERPLPEALGQLAILQMACGDLRSARLTLAQIKDIGELDQLPLNVRALLLQPSSDLLTIQQRASEWPCFLNLSATARENWLWALSNEFRAEVEAQMSEQSIRTAGLYFSKAVETELRIRLYDRLKDQYKRERKQRNRRQDDDDALDIRIRDYLLRGADLTMGDMIRGLRHDPKVIGFTRSEIPGLLSAINLNALEAVRRYGNSERHGESDTMEAEKVKASAQAVLEALNQK